MSRGGASGSEAKDRRGGIGTEVQAAGAETAAPDTPDVRDHDRIPIAACKARYAT